MVRRTPALSRTELLALGFRDADLALQRLTDLGDTGQVIKAYLGRCADPDLALAMLVDLLAALAAHSADGAQREELLAALRHDEGTVMRLLHVLGASRVSTCFVTAPIGVSCVTRI